MHGIRATRHTKTTRQWPGNSQAKKANRLDNAKSMRESSLPSQISASRYRSTTFRWARVYLHSWSFLPRHERLNLPAQLWLLLLLLLLVFLVQLDCSVLLDLWLIKTPVFWTHTHRSRLFDFLQIRPPSSWKLPSCCEPLRRSIVTHNRTRKETIAIRLQVEQQINSIAVIG